LNPNWIQISALFLLLSLSYTTEAMTGFGSIVIALTLGANFLPIEFLLPILVPLNLLLSGTIIYRHHQHIHWSIFLKKILPLMSAGVLVGLILFSLLEGPLLKRIFGGLVILFATRELIRLVRNRTGTPQAVLPLPAQIFWLFAGGVTHGIYASGGPMVVYALGGLQLTKAQFRVTLSTLWFILNLFLSITYGVAGRITPGSLWIMAILIPVVPIGVFLGERLHSRISEERFRLVIYCLLLVAGASLLR